jgi:uncharacterized protein YsxB (DUF464 family)
LVEVHIRRDSRGRLSSFFAAGHAGWADPGKDIVCAAVSTLLQAAWLGLDEVAKIDVAGVRDGGELMLAWPDASRDDPGVRAIVETVALSVITLAKQFPDHISIVYAETQDDG